MAENCGFPQLRMSGSSAFGVDNGSRERHALAAFRLTAERRIGLARASRTAARGFADFTLTQGIADADDHRLPRYCESF
jgi:hypothetical protein